MTAVAYSPGLAPVTSVVVKALQDSGRALIPNTVHDSFVSSDGTVSTGQFTADGPRIQVTHRTEVVDSNDYAQVFSTDLSQNGTTPYTITSSTPAGQYFEITPGTYTHNLVA